MDTAQLVFEAEQERGSVTSLDVSPPEMTSPEASSPEVVNRNRK
jgi:hypothetical protein